MHRIDFSNIDKIFYRHQVYCIYSSVTHFVNNNFYYYSYLYHLRHIWHLGDKAGNIDVDDRQTTILRRAATQILFINSRVEALKFNPFILQKNALQKKTFVFLKWELLSDVVHFLEWVKNKLWTIQNFNLQVGF